MIFNYKTKITDLEVSESLKKALTKLGFKTLGGLMHKSARFVCQLNNENRKEFCQFVDKHITELSSLGK